MNMVRCQSIATSHQKEYSELSSTNIILKLTRSIRGYTIIERASIRQTILCQDTVLLLERDMSVALPREGLLEMLTRI